MMRVMGISPEREPPTAAFPGWRYHEARIRFLVSERVIRSHYGASGRPAGEAGDSLQARHWILRAIRNARTRRIGAPRFQLVGHERRPEIAHPGRARLRQDLRPALRFHGPAQPSPGRFSFPD